MRRRSDQLLPLELDILEAALDLRSDGEPHFHGFAVAKRLQEQDGAKRLTAHGTLYKALARLERAGLLESSWEDPDVGAAEGRPRRRFYKVTGQAEVAVQVARRLQDVEPQSAPRLQLS
jgi:PadR family transcriptional regulator